METNISYYLIIVFSILITIVFILGLLAKNQRLKSFIPNGIVSIGILGTFLGIYIGLQYFNVKDIDSSIPKLLEGLKLSFSTSVLGIFLSVLLRFINEFRHSEYIEGVSADDIHARLVDLIGLQSFDKDVFEKLIKSNEEIQNSIQGDNESSLVTQLKNLRSDINDNNRLVVSSITNGLNRIENDFKVLNKTIQEETQKLVNEFKVFSKTISENSTKAIMQALQSVLKDFNQNITEQFGDNFKQLNDAVGSMLEWQKQYKVYLDDSKVWFNEIKSEIEGTSQALHKINDSLKTVPDSMSSVQDIVKIVDGQILTLNRTLEAFTELKDNATQALPLINENINQLTDSMKTSIENSCKILDNSIEGFTKVSDSILDSSNEISKQTKVSTDSLQDNLKLITSNFDLKIKETLDNNREIFEKSINENNQVLNNYFEALNEQLQKELQAALDLMGSHLLTLSNKFVDDYTPLTNELRKIVEISREINR